MRLSFLCLSPSHFPESCTYKVSFPKPSQTKARGQREQLESVCLFATLQYQTWAFYLWVSIYILHSTLCTLCIKASAFSACLQPCRGFLFPPHLAFCFYCLHLLVCPSASFMCVWRVLWNSLDREELLKRWTFLSALNEIWQLEYAVHDLIYPPNWKAREELNAGEGSAVCFADLGQLSHSKCFLCVVCEVSRWLMCTVASTVLGS